MNDACTKHHMGAKHPVSAAVFSDNCVLQRERNVLIFGDSQSNTEIKVILKDKNGQILAQNTGKSDKNGHWEVQLPPKKAQNDCKLILSYVGNENINEENCTIFKNVAIGEVWLAGGQSNMEFELQNCTEKAELADEKAGENVRFFYTNKNGYKDSAFYEQEKNSHWETWQSSEKGRWSAVGYFFAKKIAKELGVTVGVIGCNWGGTSASVWTAREYMEKDDDLRTYLSEYDKAVKDKSIEAQCKEYDDYVAYHEKWESGYQKLLQENPFISWDEAGEKLGKCQWPGPKSCKNPYRPSGLYDCMLSRVAPYTIKGVIWYQGENDANRAKMYHKLFSAMIDNWRTDFKNTALPFIFAQLPVHRYFNDKDQKDWCYLRQSQQKVFDSVKNAYMACILDQGEYNDIHPKAKKTVAERMANIAASEVYGIEKDEVFSPLLKDSLALTDRIELTFSHASDGFVFREDRERLAQYIEMEKVQGNTVSENESFTGFEIAGEDGVFYSAKADFGQGDKKNTITLSSPLVPYPKYARYAFYNYGAVTVFSKNGLPLAPFAI